MRWFFQCFEGIELLHVQTDNASLTIVLRLQPLLCFARIRFRHCQITLPLFERDW